MGSIGAPPLADALDAAVASYTSRHQASKKSHDEACLYMPGGNTRTVLYTSPFPFTIASAQSCFLTTIDGITYTDFLGEYTAGIYGHNHPVIRQAIEKALDNGWNYGGHNRTEQELAKLLCARFPALEMVRFVNSGTEANMMALATALVVSPHKAKKVLVFQKGYHGSTISGRTPSGKPTINLPHDFVVGQYNDIEGTKALVASLPSKSLAAILVEPMLGSGGCFEGSHDFLLLLRALATEHKALLIFDEVMTSRLTYNGLGHFHGITADLMTVGKYLGGGMTFGAFGGREDIMGLYDPRKGQLEHPGTFNNNVFTMLAGVAGCQLLTKQVIDDLNLKGETMRSQILTVLESYHVLNDGKVPLAPVTDDSAHQAEHPDKPPKMCVTGKGSLMCVHFAGPDRETLQALFFHHMLGQGIYMAQRGFIALSIEITDEHTQQFVRAVETFCAQYQASLRW